MFPPLAVRHRLALLAGSNFDRRILLNSHCCRIINRLANTASGDPLITKALEGITVVSLEHAIAAPFCTRQLAELGARVIKIERPGEGDFARSYDERVRGLSSHFVWCNRSKESLTLDIKHPQAQPILASLLQETDVLVENLAPGAAARLGLAYETLSERYPKLIVCDISVRRRWSIPR